MNRATLARLAGLAAGVAIVASCDTTAPGAINVSSNGTGSGTGTTSGSSSSSGTGPSITIDSPTVGTLINVGDSLYVRVHLHSEKGLKSASMQGFTARGSVDLGTFSLTSRYGLLTVPNGGAFRTGLKDTTVRRYLKQSNPADTTVDSLVVVVGATDNTGAADTAMTSVFIVAGPKVTIIAPNNGDSIPAGVGLSVSAHAQSGNGVGRIDIRVQGEANWPTKLDTTISQVFSNNPRDVTFSTSARIPSNAPIRGKITVSATSLDGNRQPGSGPAVVAYVRAANTAQPRVTQVVPAKIEASDSVTVNATGDAITLLGVIVRDSAGNTLQTDSLPVAGLNANAKGSVPLNLPRSLQGQRLGITAFAVDQAGRVGYAVPVTRASAEGSLGSALMDTTLLVYGHTYALPQQGTIGDITVDAARGNVFLSNTNFNQLNVWQTSATGKGFASAPIAVGSLPWGMVISNNPDTLLVANSGGTNISRVYIGSTVASSMREDLAHRILTRNTYLYNITVTRDALTGKIRLTANGPISYSDRPQYIAQAKTGRIYYSTRPTATNPAGTLRWLDPSLPVPDPRQIWQYGKIPESTVEQYVLMNVDSIAILQALPNDTASDRLTIWDHPYGQLAGSITVQNADPVLAVAAAVAANSDAELISHLDVGSLALSDTNFVAASGNKQWIAFGEGHTGGGAGRVVMVADSTGLVPNFFSPEVTISDLTDNASEQNFGIALDKTGLTVASHGLQSYFAMVSNPFHLRLQGKYDSFDDGAGIAFHPGANGVLTPQDQRLAFIGSASGNIEVVDIAYYIRRARLQLKNPIYGPLRVSLPMPGDPADVILKVFAISQQGLVVVDLTTADIKPGP